MIFHIFNTHFAVVNHTDAPILPEVNTNKCNLLINDLPWVEPPNLHVGTSLEIALELSLAVDDARNELLGHWHGHQVAVVVVDGVVLDGGAWEMYTGWVLHGSPEIAASC